MKQSAPTYIRLLAFIDTYIGEHAWAPTIREMCTAMGFASTSAAVHQLEVLETRGYIARLRGSSRAIRITPQGFQAIRRAA